MRFVIALCVLFTVPCLAQQGRLQDLTIRVDSLTGTPLPIAVRSAGSVQIGAGDSVQVAVPFASASDLVMLSYRSLPYDAVEETRTLTWSVCIEGVLSIYGTSGLTTLYLVFR